MVNHRFASHHGSGRGINYNGRGGRGHSGRNNNYTGRGHGGGYNSNHEQKGISIPKEDLKENIKQCYSKGKK